MPGRLLRLWFTLRDPVGPREYLGSGLGLMVFKYVVDATVIWHVLGDWLIGRIHQRVLAHVKQLAEG
jgi:hypothetical protein